MKQENTNIIEETTFGLYIPDICVLKKYPTISLRYRYVKEDGTISLWQHLLNIRLDAEILKELTAPLIDGYIAFDNRPSD